MNEQQVRQFSVNVMLALRDIHERTGFWHDGNSSFHEILERILRGLSREEAAAGLGITMTELSCLEDLSRKSTSAPKAIDEHLPKMTPIELGECIAALQSAGAGAMASRISKHVSRLEVEIELLVAERNRLVATRDGTVAAIKRVMASGGDCYQTLAMLLEIVGHEPGGSRG